MNGEGPMAMAMVLRSAFRGETMWLGSEQLFFEESVSIGPHANFHYLHR